MKLMSMTFFLSSEQQAAVAALPNLPWATLVNTLLTLLNDVEYSHPLDIGGFTRDLQTRMGPICRDITEREALQVGLTSFQTEFMNLYARLQIPPTNRVELFMSELRSRDYVLEIRVRSRSGATYPLLQENANVLLH